MQTFLPYTSFHRSAEALDSKRLGKQIMEAGQILRALTVDDYGWKSHPATKMWAGYEPALVRYALACGNEWHVRYGKHHGATHRIIEEFVSRYATIKPIITGEINDYLEPRITEEPWWLGDFSFHISHKWTLFAKDPIHYKVFEAAFEENGGESGSLVWPELEAAA